MADKESFPIPLPIGPFTLRIRLELIKDGKEEVGNLLRPSDMVLKFETIKAAQDFINDRLKDTPNGDPR